MSLDDISIRTELRPGDLGYVIYRHGVLYKEEFDYGIVFESYVAKGLYEFYESYDPKRNRVWIAEHEGKIIGFSLLQDRGDAAQLRYFYLEPEYRGIGLGKKLMELFIDFLHDRGYRSSYLLTTNDLKAAAHLYLKYGFRLAEEIESSVFPKGVLQQRYELTIK